MNKKAIVTEIKNLKRKINNILDDIAGYGISDIESEDYDIAVSDLNKQLKNKRNRLKQLELKLK